MFSLDIVDTDHFLDLPVTSQALYFHLGMRADDDGFVSSPKRITTFVGCDADDLKTLIERGYVIPFESGVVVITHWKENNFIRSDRYQKTRHKERDLLVLNDNVYTFRIQNDNQPDTSGIPDGNQPDTSGIPDGNQAGDKRYPQDRIGKDRIGKDRLGEDRIGEDRIESGEGGVGGVSTEADPEPTPTIYTDIAIPRKSNGAFFHVHPVELERLQKIYPRIDVVQELTKIKRLYEADKDHRKSSEKDIWREITKHLTEAAAKAAASG